ncbi:MAG: hypothetical protein IJ007_07365 [Oscillospiraceae bacterium]|nr:hypothetical protein [Oscillospiraceae bacterium]
MDIFVYGIFGSEIRLKGIADQIASLIWKRCFYGSDEFEILLPLTDRNKSLFTEGSIVEVKGKYSGFITKLNVFRRERSFFIKAEGCSFDGLLRRRILTDFKDGDSLFTVISRNCGENADEIRRFPSFETDMSCDCETELAKTYRFRSLAAFANAVGRQNDTGIMSELVHSGCRHHIRLYGKKSADRTAGQNHNRRAVFSDRYDSFYNAEYNYNENNAMTGAVVYSESKHLYDTFIPEWHGIFGEEKGFARYERAYRIQPEITYVPKTLAGATVYVPALDEKKTEQYAEYVQLSNYSGFEDHMTIYFVPEKNYTGHFDVGDKVTVECSRFGRCIEQNIRTITEHYRNGGFYAEADIGVL